MKNITTFKRAHHQRLAKILQRLNAQIFERNSCFFAGGTAIAMLCGEYRKSIDLDFLCSEDGFSAIRELINNNEASKLFIDPPFFTEIKKQRNKIIIWLNESENPSGLDIKLEIIRESDLTKADDIKICGLPVLSINDLFTQKLMANSDRGLDASLNYRDLLDIAFLCNYHEMSEIPAPALKKAIDFYDVTSIRRGFYNACINLFWSQKTESHFDKLEIGFEKIEAISQILYEIGCNLTYSIAEIEEIKTRQKQIGVSEFDLISNLIKDGLDYRGILEKLDVVSPYSVIKQREVLVEKIVSDIYDEDMTYKHRFK